VTNRLALVVAIVLGVLSILGIRFYVEKIKAQYDVAAQLVDLPVAAHDLRQGEVVTEKDIQMRKFPRAILEGLGKYMDDKVVIEGSKIVVPEIKQGEVFRQADFRRPTAQRNLRIGEGYRALTIALNVVNTVGGMLKPTDVVDVVLTSEFKIVSGPTAQVGKGLKVTRTVLKKVQILALDDKTDPENVFNDYTTATLQVTPDDANKLLNGIDTGSVIHILKLEAKEESPPGSNPWWDNRHFHDVEPEINKQENTWGGRPR
jgi:pilus assembly protein CpaB